ncbi:aldehyde dehydrogenase [Lentinus tigrinus ALCF2SS1-7]|uniref:Aldehyde dehydrogenase n=1 Tax=Lentinus tigrinus ALCF2SS1-6 TaxID=1328759 RepID=A0A5C2SK43_9APHY|nr:aldehyde dehydrogenase [Lentinus tigrinus ALCF2SS1-6]RPD76382.1 aldehyde dehydrogenase [Lentinus tigrinus ALCF2SS1-7]
MSLPFTPLFIDGEWRPASTGASFEVRNPTTGEVVGTAASASAEDCIAAVEAAARVFPAWEQTPLMARRDILLRAADILATDRYKDKVATFPPEELSSTEDMFPFNYLGEIGLLRNYASLAMAIKGEAFQSVIPGGQVMAQRRAFGVVFGIAPWNAPTGLTIRAIALPIICGNTVVLKSSEESPRTQAIIAELFEEAGLPRGVLNFISVSKEDAPARTAEIIAHPLVRKINFTGGDLVGRIIAMEAAKYLKPVVLELGGKAPAIVLDDADIPRAARAITFSALLNSGQICMSTERVIIQRGAAPALVHELTALFKQAKAGDIRTEPSAVLGALFTEKAAENVVGMMRDAVSHGATLVVGDLSRQGAVVQPHILMNVRPGMQLWERESFGPVVVVAVIDTIDEAVELANSSEYSMSAALWTKDIHTALDVSARIRAYCTNINGPTIHGEPMRTLGGLGGASGYGYFNIEDWTQFRMTVLHPTKELPYPVVRRLRNVARPTANGTNGHVESKVNGTNH